MSTWPHWCCPAEAFNCRQTSGQHETAENWTSVDVCNVVMSGVNCVCKILPERVFKRRYCRTALLVGLGVAQLFMHKSRSWALLRGGFPERCGKGVIPCILWDHSGGSGRASSRTCNLHLDFSLQAQCACCLLALPAVGSGLYPLTHLHSFCFLLFLAATRSENFCYAVQRGGACPGDQQRIQQADAHAPPSEH